MRPDFSNINMTGRLCYLFMCIERYLIGRWPDRDWTPVAECLWQWTGQTWDISQEVSDQIIPEYILLKNNYEDTNNEYFDGELKRDLYDSLVKLYEGITSADPEDELNQVLFLTVEWGSVCEGASFEGADAPTKGYIDWMISVLEKYKIELPDSAKVLDFTLDQNNGWGDFMDSRYLSIILEQPLEEPATEDFIKLSYDELKSFARGERLFSEIVKKDRYEEDLFALDVRADSKYQMTFDDFYSALKNVDTLKRDAEDFLEDWFEPLFFIMGPLVGVPTLTGHPEMEDMYCILDIGGNEFARSEAMLIINILNALDEDKAAFYGCCIDDDEVLDHIRDYAESIHNFSFNKDARISEWRFTNREKDAFLKKYSKKSVLREVGTEKILLFRRVLEERCAEGNLEAIQIKGYACYGDRHPVYSCDWFTARDCMLELVEKGNDWLKAVSANTLGYIYYYGRCNDGEPEYEEAYKYFSMAAFYGLHESTYKVGDMLAKGYGIIKNEKAAYQCYANVYLDCYRKFQNGNQEHVLSDAALRMGRAYRDGIGTPKDLMKAYNYLLQAKVAIDLRMKKHDFYGINTVHDNIYRCLGEVKEELLSEGYEIDADSCSVDPRVILEMISAGQHKMELSVSEEDDFYILTFTRLKQERYDHNPKTMVTIPEVSFCMVTDYIKLKYDKKGLIHLKNNADSVSYDSMEVDNGSISFYEKKKRVARVEYVEMIFDKTL